MSKKKPNGVQLLLRAVVKEPDGKVLSDTGQKPAKSFVIQFLEGLYAIFTGPVDGWAHRTDNAWIEIYHGGIDLSYHLKVNAGVNDGTHGILVGTGSTAETNADYKLEAQLTEGTEVGNITHGAMDIETAAVVGSNVDLELKRALTNNTGSLITVNEAGLYTLSNNYFLLIRDVLASGVEVPDKCSLTIYYTLRTTV